MPGGSASGRDGSVVLRIRIETIRPLTGTAGREGQAAMHFAGWLGLLRLLADTVGSSSVAQDMVGELAPRRDPEFGEDVRDVRFHCSLRDE